MMKLTGRTTPTKLASHIHPEVWRVCTSDTPPGDGPIACLVAQVGRTAAGHQLYLARSDVDDGPGPTIRLPQDLDHVDAGDVVGVASDGRRLNVLWKQSATHNSILLTEQCDNYCLMCSQPPKDREDAWMFDRAFKIVDLISGSATSLGLTGGEPTLQGGQLLKLLAHCRDRLPATSLHLLSNGRRFADPAFARRYAAVNHPDLMVGIPVYGAEPARHDFVVQARGAFDETVRGILNLAALGQQVEIRVVVQRHTVPVLVELAQFIARNLPFVSQVVLMGLEMTGLARPNSKEVWIDPVDYQAELLTATMALTSAHIETKIYNHQLCVLDHRLWAFAVRSISDWKNDYLQICKNCSALDRCGGVFTTSGSRLSTGLHAV
jgi:His-Xaa-Ser system radical SAM maturase HxsC